SRSEQDQPGLGLLDASLKPTLSTTGKTRKPISSSPDNSHSKEAQSVKRAKKRTFKKKAKKAGTKALGSKSSTAKKQSARSRHSPKSKRRAVKKRKCPSPSPETSCSSSDE
ncbi:unnamed protein product, partial [Ixodes pacificus]